MLLQAGNGSFSGLTLSQNETQSIATLEFEVLDAGISLLEVSGPPGSPLGVFGVFFENIPVTVGGPITFSPTVAIPEPSGLSLFAIGAVGYVTRRRRRS